MSSKILEFTFGPCLSSREDNCDLLKKNIADYDEEARWFSIYLEKIPVDCFLVFRIFRNILNWVQLLQQGKVILEINERKISFEEFTHMVIFFDFEMEKDWYKDFFIIHGLPSIFNGYVVDYCNGILRMRHEDNVEIVILENGILLKKK